MELRHNKPQQLANAQQMFQAYLDKSTPYTPYRWGGTALLFLAFGLRPQVYRLHFCAP
jgi:hypothetical protein